MISESTHNSGTIKVSAITLGHLSRGLYRNTAAVYKELISNSYDADATEVRIFTNYPDFDYFSCVDNGEGMPKDAFLNYYDREGIGSCTKRKEGDRTNKFKRPIIGRLGIGMMAVGQICNSFEIESHYLDERGDGKAYIAKIIMLSTDTKDDDYYLSKELKGEDGEDIELGKWSIEMVDYDKNREGFRIFSSDIRSTYRRSMKGSSEAKGEKLPFSPDKFYECFYRNIRSISEYITYFETIWQLSMLCPLPYPKKIKEFPIRLNTFMKGEKEKDDFKNAIELIEKQREYIDDLDFKVYLDGFELKRYVKLPTEDVISTKLYSINYDGVIAKKPLKFYGYLFAQISEAIKPIELNGVQVRLKGFGIGHYDPSFLNYSKKIPTIRSRWISSEIFVNEGLELALNIDRDSFNEHDEHYKKLQSEFHNILDRALRDIDNEHSNILKRKKEDQDKKITDKMGNIIDEYSSGEIKYIEKKLGKKSDIVFFDEKNGKIILNTSRRISKKINTNKILQVVEVAYSFARIFGENELERYKIFHKFIIDTFGEKYVSKAN